MDAHSSCVFGPKRKRKKKGRRAGRDYEIANATSKLSDIYKTIRLRPAYCIVSYPLHCVALRKSIDLVQLEDD
jgi:hypothetical protein